MVQAITIALTGKNFEILAGLDVPYSEQRRNFRHLRKTLAGSCDCIQLWSSGHGIVKRHTFSKSPVVQAELALNTDSNDATALLGEPETPVDSVVPTPAPAAKPKKGKSHKAKTRAKRK